MPGSTGAEGFDVLLAALTAREFTAADGTPPAWSRVEPLVVAWIPEHPFMDRDKVVRQTPDFLSGLNVFVPARDLVTA